MTVLRSRTTATGPKFESYNSPFYAAWQQAEIASTSDG